MGRPSDYTPEIAKVICARLADGQSLRAICADADMPHRSTVHDWVVANKEFADQYARAREVQADTLFDQCLEIADESKGDMTVDEDGKEVVNQEAIQRARLRVDTRKWMAGKLRPKAYGDRIEHAGDSSAPIVVEIVRFGAGPASE